MLDLLRWFTNEADQSRGKELAKVTYAPITNVLGSDEIDGCKDEKRRELWNIYHGNLVVTLPEKSGMN